MSEEIVEEVNEPVVEVVAPEEVGAVVEPKEEIAE